METLAVKFAAEWRRCDRYMSHGTVDRLSCMAWDSRHLADVAMLPSTATSFKPRESYNYVSQVGAWIQVVIGLRDKESHAVSRCSHI